MWEITNQPPTGPRRRTTIFTEDTNNSISFSAVTGLPKDYKEIEFQILSTGGAEVTGLSFKEEITGKRQTGVTLTRSRRNN